MIPLAKQFTGLHDMAEGPCACGATHKLNDWPNETALISERDFYQNRLKQLQEAKRPFSDKLADEVIEGQVERIKGLERKLNGWFLERDSLRAQLTAAKADGEQTMSLLRRCHPFLVHALCTIPKDVSEYSEASRLSDELDRVAYPEVMAAFAADAARAQEETK